MMNNPLLDLIKNNDNWQDILREAPRYIKIKQCPFENEDGNLKWPELYMLSYDSILSDFTDEIVRYCRGCVISIEDHKNPKMVVFPFTKFGNVGESYCPEIDWNSALVQQKVDGIMIKFFNYKNEWVWITNNGWHVNLPFKDITKLVSKYKEKETCHCHTIKHLIEYSFKSVGLNFYVENNLNPNYTYMFELLSPRLRILVDNPKTELVYTGSRNNITGQELTLQEAYTINPDLKKFRTVKYFDLHDMNSVLTLCNSYKGDEDEGVVICDKYFNRVKIKCADYVKLKFYRDVLSTSDQAILDAIKNGTVDDALNIFPEMGKNVDRIRRDLGKYKHFIEKILKVGKRKFDEISSKENNEKLAKKIYAEWVLTQPIKYKGFLFEVTRKIYDSYELAAKAKYGYIIKMLYGKDIKSE